MSNVTKQQKPASDAEILINSFGGLSKASRALGCPISTVNSWREKGRIPSWRRDPVLSNLRSAGHVAAAHTLEKRWSA